jgi:hypothetical protein
MNRRQILRIAGGGFIAAATVTLTACDGSMPPEAIADWQPPTDSLEIRRWVLSHALLAPNAHNLQSWLVDLGTEGTIVLRMDMNRLLPETDPLSHRVGHAAHAARVLPRAAHWPERDCPAPRRHCFEHAHGACGKCFGLV